jgi:hypothetical protein
LDDALSSLTNPHSEDAYTSLEERLALAFEWLSNCDQNHALYLPKSNIESNLPTRVVAVRNGLDDPPRIYKTKRQRGYYVALSYCWGRIKSIVLTGAALETYKCSLPIDDLLLTIQNAIEVTYKLGFSYLWIDALCIVQDSDSDKASELDFMADIYRNIALASAAAKGVDPSSGLFSIRNPWHCRLYKFDLKVAMRTEKIIINNVFIFDEKGKEDENVALDTSAFFKKKLCPRAF